MPVADGDRHTDTTVKLPYVSATCVRFQGSGRDHPFSARRLPQLNGDATSVGRGMQELTQRPARFPHAHGSEIRSPSPCGRLMLLSISDAGRLEFGKEFCAFLPECSRTPLLCLPTVFQCPLPLWSIYQKQQIFSYTPARGSRLADWRRKTPPNLVFMYFFSYVAHMSNIKETAEEGTMLIRNLSKMDFEDKSFENNYLNLQLILLVLSAACNRERVPHMVNKYAKYKYFYLFTNSYINIPEPASDGVTDFLPQLLIPFLIHLML